MECTSLTVFLAVVGGITVIILCGALIVRFIALFEQVQENTEEIEKLRRKRK